MAATLALALMGLPGLAFAQALPGGSLDPTTIPKYVTPLVIPPVMNDNGTANEYDIAVRQFQQQILPSSLPATTVWGYGPDADPTPTVAPSASSQFNYPSYTLETTSGTPVSVRWINELVQDPDNCNFASPVGDSDCDYLSHLLPIDQTLHWANPPQDCADGSTSTDCAGDNPDPYTGPVPIVTHVHGAHVQSNSDGYPEAWWLPHAGNIPAGYATSGRLYDDANGGSGDRGYADFVYQQDQPATTLWYHDHSLGMTRSNVYAGPAGFWLVRGGANDMVTTGKGRRARPAVLPGPWPKAGDAVLPLNTPGDPLRDSIREIPIVIQDRSFNTDGSLFYPGNRAFFEGLNVPGQPQQFSGAGDLEIDFVPNSDIAPIWNPEAFFNVMVVNGVSWPTLEVANAPYRFRLLNGCDARFLNLALVYTYDKKQAELPFVQIGAEQGFLPHPVEVLTGFATPILNGRAPSAKQRVPASDPQQALLMGNAERADVIVDFSGLPNGTVVTMINTGPDEPFGGFPVTPSDPGTTGQVMRFVVNSQLRNKQDGMTTDAYALNLPAENALGGVDNTRQVSLNELESEVVCVEVDMSGNTVQVTGTPPDCPEGSMPFGPKEALLGTVDLSGAPAGIPLKWTDNSGASTAINVTLESGAVVPVMVTENPTKDTVEQWQMYNFTGDAHPIHLHLVRFQVVGRQAIPGIVPPPVPHPVEPWETGFKDTVITYPDEITTVKALFDIAGLYVWHCHIVEHEDNEMMRPYVVSEPQASVTVPISSTSTSRRRARH